MLDRIGPGGGRATITLGEFVEEYLEMHDAAPVTIAKLRWLLGKATSVLGEKRLAELSPSDVYAWRFTVPQGHRFLRRATLVRPGSEHWTPRAVSERVM